MKTVLSIFQADWAPSMEASARALAMVVAIPAAIVLVLAQWLLFTWRRPLAGVLALVPVRKPEMAYSSARLAMASQVVTSRIIDPVVSPTTEISPALDAALDQALGLKRPALIVTSTPQLALGSGPRVGRRGSKEATEAFDRAVLAPRPRRKGSSKVATLDHLDRAAERDRYRDHSRDDG